ncbi:L-fucose:H+ symporter permease [Flavihumibacter profundi]|jgi:MFS transporter, FHS family, L-fucose permease|uniref:L-fucose:H+ symporter permease n=1 Tax=Flavihumibacter profundi TaxID=2716883 RepID=UPI001CC434F1|nr:L-fucose:H+ symporter permease [Flavihumibacter profundi]MBZ5855927.1 L-fucose:H+ symporter permease [Flavihumibacter profundi]
MPRSNKYLLPFILVTSLFFLWAFLHNINPILIPHLKKACQLSDTQSALIDFSVYMGYFAIALPAGWFMNKYGFKKGLLFGLILYGAGALLFYPAAATRSYTFFLFALFVIAAGATFLETVANPYITKLGDPSTATQRLNFAQSFNGVGAFVAPIIGGKFILSGIEHSKNELNQMQSSGTLNAYLQTEADTIKMPYLIIGALVFLLVVIFYIVKLPEGEEATTELKPEDEKFSLAIMKNRQVRNAVIAQFFYIGAQVCVGSFFIRFSRYVMDLPEKDAAYWWGSIAMVGFMVGRFTGTFLMKYIRPARLLLAYSLISAILLIAGTIISGPAAVFCIMATPFFMSIMFPTIFALGINGLGHAGRMASSLLVMSIVGGAFFPLIMGQVSDLTGGNIQLAYIVPLLCFVVVGWFAWSQSKQDITVVVSAAH